MTYQQPESEHVIQAIIKVYPRNNENVKAAHYEDSAQALIHFDAMQANFNQSKIEVWLAKPEMTLHARKTFELFLEGQNGDNKN